LSRQHPEPPADIALVASITHVALAFMSSSLFNQVTSDSTSKATNVEWPFFTTVNRTRTQFQKGTKVLIAIGGWGDDEGFEVAARTEEGQELWASNVATMVTDTGADGLYFLWLLCDCSLALWLICRIQYLQISKYEFI
jgi:GH18 family chitinase